jgi:hypothetical protein
MRVIAAIALVLLLGGCVPAPPAETPAPTPGPTPVFASEEEALAAAEEAYAAYLAVSDAIAQDGGRDPERLAPHVTPGWLEKEVEVFELFAASGRRLVGETQLRSSHLQQISDDGRLPGQLVAYFCTDFASTRIVDSSGADVTPTDREAIVTLEVSFVIESQDSARLLVDGSAPWVESSLC